MTYGKRQYDSIDSIMRRSIAPLYEAMQTLLTLIDKDTNAFNSYMVRNNGGQPTVYIDVSLINGH